MSTLIAALIVAGFATPLAAAETCVGPACASSQGGTYGSGSCSEGAPYHMQHNDWRVKVKPNSRTDVDVWTYNGCAAYDENGNSWKFSWLYLNAAVVSNGQLLFYGHVGWFAVDQSGSWGEQGACQVYYFEYSNPGGSGGYGRDCSVLGTYPAPPVVPIGLP